MAMFHEADASDDSGRQASGLKTIEVYVYGKVQGVGFRACVKRIASHLLITGEVMNLEDGRVCVRATGDDIIIDKFISSLHECPRAYIRDIEIFEKKLTEFDDFSIVRVF